MPQDPNPRQRAEAWLRQYVTTLPGLKVGPDAVARVTPKGGAARSVYSDLPALASAGAEVLNTPKQAFQAGQHLAERMSTHGAFSGASAGAALAAAPMVLPGGSLERLAGRVAKAVAPRAEKLAAAAVRYPDGSIGYGPSHFHALQHGAAGHDLAQTAEGFITDSGRFLDRAEADKLLGGAGSAELHSADVPNLSGFAGKKMGLIPAKAGAPLPPLPAPKVDPIESLRRAGLLLTP